MRPALLCAVAVCTAHTGRDVVSERVKLTFLGTSGARRRCRRGRGIAFRDAVKRWAPINWSPVVGPADHGRRRKSWRTGQPERSMVVTLPRHHAEYPDDRVGFRCALVGTGGRRLAARPRFSSGLTRSFRSSGARSTAATVFVSSTLVNFRRLAAGCLASDRRGGLYVMVSRPGQFLGMTEAAAMLPAILSIATATGPILAGERL